jgi:hypothetical protein
MQKDEKVNLRNQEQKRKKRRRSRQRVGLAVSILTVVGVFSLVFGGVKGVQFLLDNSKEKAEYEATLAPLVMLDPLPFDSLDKANHSTLMQAAVWACVYNNDISTYERDELGALMLPAIEIEREAMRLYGPDFTFTRETFTDSGMEFVYSEEKDVYIMPITSQAGMYTPQVVRITGWREKVVTVGYVSPFGTDGGFASPSNTPVKYVEYVFARGRDGYYLIAIRESDMKPEVSVSSINSEAPASFVDIESETTLSDELPEPEQPSETEE